jgi:hypothetical protein
MRNKRKYSYNKIAISPQPTNNYSKKSNPSNPIIIPATTLITKTALVQPTISPKSPFSTSPKTPSFPPHPKNSNTQVPVPMKNYNITNQPYLTITTISPANDKKIPSSRTNQNTSQHPSDSPSKTSTKQAF